MSASDPEGIGLLPELNTNYDGRRGHLGHASLYSDGWWLGYTTLRAPELREPWVRSPNTGAVYREVTTAYPLRGFEVDYWKVGIAPGRQVEISQAFVDHDAASHLPNEVVCVDGKWVLYKDHARELRSRIPTSRRVRPPDWSSDVDDLAFPEADETPTYWNAHKILRMEADDEALFAENKRRERDGRPYMPFEMRRERALHLYNQSKSLYAKLRDSYATTLSNARVFRIPLDACFFL